MNEQLAQIILNTTAALVDNPTYMEAFYERGKAYFLQANYEQATADLTAAYNIKPTAEALYWRAFCYRKLDQPLKAIDDLSGAIGIRFVDPNISLADAYCHRGLLREEVGSDVSGFNDYEQALQIDPSHTLSLGNRGVVYRKQLNNQAAEADLSLAISQAPHPYYHYNRGLARMASNNTTGAMEDFSAAISINATYSDAYYARGLLAEQQNQLNTAVDDYTSTIANRADHPEAYKRRATAYYQMEQLGNAVNDYQKQVALLPDDSLTWHSLAEVYRQMNRYDDAIEAAQNAIAIEPTANAYCTIGRAHLGFNRYEKSIEQFDQALLLNPEYANAYFFKAVVLATQKQDAEALLALHEALSRDPLLTAYAHNTPEFFHIKANERYQKLWDKFMSDGSPTEK